MFLSELNYDPGYYYVVFAGQPSVARRVGKIWLLAGSNLIWRDEELDRIGIMIGHNPAQSSVVAAKTRISALERDVARLRNDLAVAKSEKPTGRSG